MSSDEIKMEVNIAGERISLTVPFSRQEAVRKTEYELGKLYRRFGETFPKKAPKELLAMVAYKFASSYLDAVQARESDREHVLDLLHEVDSLCGDSDSCSSGEVHDEFPLY